MPNNNQSEEVERILEIFGEEAQGEGGFLLTMDPSDCPDVRDWLKDAFTTHGASEYARGKSEERGRIKPLLERIRLDVNVIKCDCGEPYKDSDLDISVGDLEEALSQENTLKE